MKSIIYICLILFFSPITLSGQKTNLKVQRNYDKAVQLYSSGNLEEAKTSLSDLINSDSGFVRAYLLLGDLYNQQGEKKLAIDAYRKAIKTDSTFFIPANYILGNLLFEQQQYDEAKVYYRKYLATNPKSQTEINTCNKNCFLCDFRQAMLKNPEPFNPVNLGPAINTNGYEFINSLSIDERILFFTHRDVERGSNELFFWAKKINGEWSQAEEMPPPLNSDGSQGALTFSPDGTTIFFAGCNRPDSYGSCDIYKSKRLGGTWLMPENLGPIVNSISWDSQPSLSSDGKTLYFASSRSGGNGGSDIYYTVLQEDGSWSQPINLGDSINTSDSETNPFIHPDGTTLYFSSKGHPGMGGSDLFVSKKKPDGQWSKPKNLGYPINTNDDEINLIVNSSGNLGYISSERNGGYGKTDIYQFDMPLALRPQKVSYVKGKVYDAKTKMPLLAKFELIDLKLNRTVVNSFSDSKSGDFLLSLPIGKNYALNVSSDSHLFYSLNFSLEEYFEKIKPMTLDIPLEPISIGSSTILRNIFFDTDKYEIKPESQVELQKLITFLEKNPKTKIEISGFTDNVGNDSHNLQLSEKRAFSVYNYLLMNGIDKFRLTYRGYGNSKPADTNNTEEGRANNRRTEFKIISN